MLKGSEKNKVEDRLKEIEDNMHLMKKKTYFFDDEGIKWVLQDLKQRMSKLDNNSNERSK